MGAGKGEAGRATARVVMMSSNTQGQPTHALPETSSRGPIITSDSTSIIGTATRQQYQKQHQQQELQQY
jgi:folate-dependent phosphoribosylglycinamide formyltransferase PurN